jgi:hypothetical protein
MSSLLLLPVDMRRPDGGGAEPEALRERLVDDRHARAPRPIALGELASGAERDAHGAEEVRAHLREPGVRLGVGAAHEALHRHVAPPVAAGQQRHGRFGDAGHPRHRRERLVHAVEQGARADGRVAVLLWREREGDEVLDVDPERLAAHVAQTLHEQPGRHEERHRQGDLGGDERGAEARGDARGADHLAGAGADRADQVGARAVQRREEPEGEPRRERHRGGERHGPPVEREVQHLERFGLEQRADAGERPARDHEPRRAPEQREHARLGEQLRDEPPPTGAERQPHGHLRLAARAAGEQEVGDVGAGDEQDDAGDAEEECERGLGLLVHGALPAGAGRHRDLARAELGHRPLGHPLLQRRLHLGEHGAVHGIELPLRGVDRRARLERPNRYSQ